MEEKKGEPEALGRAMAVGETGRWKVLEELSSHPQCGLIPSGPAGGLALGHALARGLKRKQHLLGL